MLFLAILFFIIISILNLRLASLILIVLLPSYLLRFQIFFLPTTFLEIMIGIVFIVWLAKNIKNKNLINIFQKFKNKFDNSFLIILFLFILTATIAVFVSLEIK